MKTFIAYLVLFVSVAIGQDTTYIVAYSAVVECPECISLVNVSFSLSGACTVPTKTVYKLDEYATKEEAARALNNIPEFARAKARLLTATPVEIKKTTVETRVPQPDKVTVETKLAVDGVVLKDPEPLTAINITGTGISSGAATITSDGTWVGKAVDYYSPLPDAKAQEFKTKSKKAKR